MFWKHGQHAQLLWLIAPGSVPAAITGLLLDDWIEENLRQPWLVALALAAVGVVMLLVDRKAQQTRAMATVGITDAILIGVAQAFALFPGVSRSGATMSVGLVRGLTRVSAARFSFLLGTPAFVGAAVLKSTELTRLSAHESAELAIGFAFSALGGFLVIHFLMLFLRTRTLMPFIVYRFAVAGLTLVIAAIRVA